MAKTVYIDLPDEVFEHFDKKTGSIPKQIKAMLKEVMYTDKQRNEKPVKGDYDGFENN